MLLAISLLLSFRRLKWTLPIVAFITYRTQLRWKSARRSDRIRRVKYNSLWRPPGDGITIKYLQAPILLLLNPSLCPCKRVF